MCLIESGGFRPEPATQELCGGIVTGPGNFDPESSRLRAFGGSTNVWGGGCIPLGNLDFARREWVPYSGWPISYAQLQPYYQRARALFRIDGHEFREGSFKTTPVKQPLSFEGDALENRNFIISPVFFGQAFRNELEQAPNIQLLLHANVTALETCSNAASVRLVRARSLAGQSVTVRARQYVLACGGIENARLMLLSNATAPNGIGNARDLVGRYFMDHPKGRLGTVRTAVPERIARAYDRSGRTGPAPCFPELCLSDTSLRRHSLLNTRVQPFAVEGVVPKGVQGLRDIRKVLHKPTHDEAMALEGKMPVVGSAHSKAAGTTARRPLRSIGKAAVTVGFNLDHVVHAWRRKRAEKPAVATERVDAMGYFEQAPNPDSRVRLGDDIDALGQRKVVVDWRLTELDWHTYRTAATLFGGELAKASNGQFTPDGWLQGQAGDTAQVSGTSHHMGTTRMSDNANDGVVDLHSRVHGVDNLYIAGSSVFPTGGWAFPTFTIVALSLRLAEHLRALF